MAQASSATATPQKNDESSNLTAPAQEKKAVLEAFLRTPLVINDSDHVKHDWKRDQKLGMALLEHTLQQAQKQEKPAVVGLMERTGEVNSVLKLSLYWPKESLVKVQSVLAPLIKAGCIDVREQLRFECAVVSFNAAQYQYASATRQSWHNRHSTPVQVIPPASWETALSCADDQVFARWLLGEDTGLSAAVSRDVLKRWAPVLAKQHPKDTPAMVHGGLDIAAQIWSKVKLPKASSPSPFTPEQKELHFLLGVCEKIVASVEKALIAAGQSVSRTQLIPPSLQEMQDAFDAKARKMEEREQAREKDGSTGEGSGGEDAGDASASAAGASRAQQRIENGRYTMARTATEHLDFKALQWITENDADQGAWIGVAENASGLLALVAGNMRSHSTDARDGDVDQRLGAQFLEFFLDKGLNLLEEAAVSYLRTDNPFVRLKSLCNTTGGAWNVAITKAMLRHMREAGLELKDAEAFFEEVMGGKVHDHEREQFNAFGLVAQAGLQRWQLDAELEQHAREKAQKVPQDRESAESSAQGPHNGAAGEGGTPSTGTPRRRHRL